MKTRRPLAGLRVVDVTQYAAGPVATLLLADYGADVIKIEPLTGDPFRQTRAVSIADTNPGFLALNRNKRSLALDLRTPEGQAIVRRLAAGSDVFIENFRSGTADRLNIGYERLRRRNRRLVYCSISGFGSTGPYRDKPAVDVIAQAMAGMMDQTGDEDRAFLVGTPLADYLGGIFGALGVLLALLGRDRRGRGEHVEVSLVDGLLFVLGLRFAEVFVTGRTPPRRGAGHAQTAPGGVFRARDGDFTVAVMNPDSWPAFCEAIDMPALATDGRFATNSLRVRNRAELLGILEKVLRTRPRAYWLDRISARNIPCGPVNTLVDVLNDPALSTVVLNATYRAHELRMIGAPVRLAGETATVYRSPPAPGADTADILARAGLTPQQVRRLEAAGVIKLADAT